MFTKTAVTVYAQYHQRGADVRFPDGARIAVPAADHRVDGDALAQAGAVDTLAHGVDHAEKLMADHARILRKRVVPAVDVAV